MKKALVFEPNPYHFTCIPSYIRALNQLNYEVTLLVHNSFSTEEELSPIFSEAEAKCEIRYFDCLAELCDGITDLWKDFDLVWCTTVIAPQDNKDNYFFDLVGSHPNPPDGLFGTVHDFSNQEKFIKKENFAALFILKSVEYLSLDCQFFSPSYFGRLPSELELRKKKSNSLAAIGLTLSLNGVLRPVSSFKTNDLTLNIIGSRCDKLFTFGGFTRQFVAFAFRLNTHFWRKMHPLNPSSLANAFKRINKLGYLKSNEMYQVLRETKFLVANYEGDQLEAFINQRVSGTSQLSRGFCVPLIVNKTIAESWGFSKDVAVVYEDGHFEEGLEKALSMTQDEYVEMCCNLKQKAISEWDASLQKIQDAILKNRIRCK